MKGLPVVLAHVITNLMIQAAVWAMIIWRYDVNVRSVITYGVLCAALLLADCLISAAIVRREGGAAGKWLHFVDLILAAPGVWMVIREIVRKGVLMPGPNLYVVIATLVIDALLVAERIALAKKKA